MDEGSAGVAKDALHNYKLDGENKIKVRHFHFFAAREYIIYTHILYLRLHLLGSSKYCCIISSFLSSFFPSRCFWSALDIGMMMDLICHLSSTAVCIQVFWEARPQCETNDIVELVFIKAGTLLLWEIVWASAVRCTSGFRRLFFCYSVLFLPASTVVALHVRPGDI